MTIIGDKIIFHYRSNSPDRDTFSYYYQKTVGDFNDDNKIDQKDVNLAKEFLANLNLRRLILDQHEKDLENSIIQKLISNTEIKLPAYYYYDNNQQKGFLSQWFNVDGDPTQRFNQDDVDLLQEIVNLFNDPNLNNAIDSILNLPPHLLYLSLHSIPIKNLAQTYLHTSVTNQQHLAQLFAKIFSENTFQYYLSSENLSYSIISEKLQELIKEIINQAALLNKEKIIPAIKFLFTELTIINNFPIIQFASQQIVKDSFLNNKIFILQFTKKYPYNSDIILKNLTDKTIANDIKFATQLLQAGCLYLDVFNPSIREKLLTDRDLVFQGLHNNRHGISYLDLEYWQTKDPEKLVQWTIHSLKTSEASYFSNSSVISIIQFLIETNRKKDVENILLAGAASFSAFQKEGDKTYNKRMITNKLLKELLVFFLTNNPDTVEKLITQSYFMHEELEELNIPTNHLGILPKLKQAFEILDISIPSLFGNTKQLINARYSVAAPEIKKQLESIFPQSFFNLVEELKSRPKIVYLSGTDDIFSNHNLTNLMHRYNLIYYDIDTIDKIFSDIKEAGADTPLDVVISQGHSTMYKTQFGPKNIENSYLNIFKHANQFYDPSINQYLKKGALWILAHCSSGKGENYLPGEVNNLAEYYAVRFPDIFIAAPTKTGTIRIMFDNNLWPTNFDFGLGVKPFIIKPGDSI